MDVEQGRPDRVVKIMLVDSSLTLRLTAETLLRREGYTIFTAEDGFQALASIVDNQPDIVFLEAAIPRLNGYQTCSIIKASRLFRKTPVIMLSSKDSVFDKARGKLAGCDHFMNKPVTKEDLIAVIHEYVPAIQ